MNNCDGKVTWKVTIPVSLMCVLFLVTFITPVHAAVGDLILDTEILLPSTHFYNAENATKSSTLLKEGYSISLDGMRWVIASQGKEICVTNYSIFKNGDVVKRIRVIGDDYFYYNKTIDGKEYTIIEANVYAIFVGVVTDIVKLKPFRQYSDGSVIVEPDFITPSLNPYTNETPPEEWNRTFGRVYFGRYGQSLQQTSDGGYILTGSKYLYTTDISGSAFLLKTDTNGNEQWNRTFENIGLKNAYSVQQTLDGGYLLAGFSYLEPGYAWLTKTDKNGSVQWIETFAALKPSNACSVWQTPDGGYILTSGTKLYEGGSTEAWVIKTDVNGKQEWNKTFESDCFDEVYSIEQTHDGGYLLAGSKGSFETGYNACLVKTDANGIEQWNRTIGPGLIARISSIRQTLDGGYLLAGSKGSFDKSYNTCLVKTDANGIEQWNRTIGPGLIARISSIWQVPDGGYVLAGKIDTARNPEIQGQILYSDDDAWLFKIDASGNMKWSKTFGGLRNDEARFAQQTSDGGYIIAGTTESHGTGGSDLWLVKVAGKEVDFVQPCVSANNTSMEEVLLSDNNVTETLQSPPGKSIPGFEFTGVVFSVFVILLLKIRWWADGR